MVSALQGLRDVIVKTQTVLLDAAIKADVPRFIPSDFSIDFTKFPPGENRNLDLRRDFHQRLDQTSISATTIFNGAFADMLTGQMPLILFKLKRVLYWGDADQRMDFTTMDDTAAFTAGAALDPSTPRFLRISGNQLSARELTAVVSEVTEKKFRLFRAGGLGMLGTLIKVARMLAPGEKELYPAWQGRLEPPPRVARAEPLGPPSLPQPAARPPCRAGDLVDSLPRFVHCLLRSSTYGVDRYSPESRTLASDYDHAPFPVREWEWRLHGLLWEPAAAFPGRSLRWLRSFDLRTWCRSIVRAVRRLLSNRFNDAGRDTVIRPPR